MRVLSLTHAHLNPEGLSPVSCERADSFTGMWGQELNWSVDVVHTSHTKWRGPWPNGDGLKVNIIHQEAPHGLIMSAPVLFSVTVKKLLAQKNIGGLFSAFIKRISKRVRHVLSAEGFVFPYEIMLAEKWGAYLAASEAITTGKYDFIFVCIGFGDEYLLQTALTLSGKLGVPMVVDFRDLWADHHEAGRFTNKQRKLVRKYEQRLLSRTILVSAPQKPMVAYLQDRFNIPAHLASHSAYIESGWEDGRVIQDEFRLLYSGKIYWGNKGLTMIIDLVKKLSLEKLIKPVKCYFFVDDPARLNEVFLEMGISDHVVVSGWITPSALWKEIRSAHALLTFDSGMQGGMPLLMTKVYQYAYSGRAVLAMCPYGNSNYEDFFNASQSGSVCTTADEALQRVKNLVNDEQQYQLMPNFRKILSRTEVAIEFGRRIESVMGKS